MMEGSEDSEEDYSYILPQEQQCITAADCLRLLQAIQRGELDEFDLKNEINAQWNKGYSFGKQEARIEREEMQRRGL